MRKINTVSLIGLGAIGAAYGSFLNDSLKDSFSVVANAERINRYQKDGIKINGKTHNFHYITPESKTEPADLAIFSVKNAELPHAIRDMENHIGPDTIILSLLNGISSEGEIYAASKNNHILYSISVEIDAVRQNNEITYSNIGRICFGGKGDSFTDDVFAVKELFQRVGIPFEIPEDISHTLWWKFMINVGINQTSAILKAPYGVFQKVPEAYQWMESAMYEVADLSEKAGVHLTEADVKKFCPILNNLSPLGKTSMLQDIEAGRKTEVEYFAGKVCELGRKYNVKTPVNDQLYQIIRILEEIPKLSLKED